MFTVLLQCLCSAQCAHMSGRRDTTYVLSAEIPEFVFLFRNNLSCQWKRGSFFYHIFNLIVMHNVKKQIQIVFLANTHQPKTNNPGLCPPWLQNPQVCWHDMRIVPSGKTYLSPTRIPGKTSSEILRTLPALPISLKLSPRGFTLLFSPPLSLYSSATQVAVLFTTSDFWRQ